MLPAENRLLLITPAGASAMLGISKRTLDRWVKEGRLKCTRLSDGPKAQRRFTLGHLEDFIAAQGNDEGGIFE